MTASSSDSPSVQDTAIRPCGDTCSVDAEVIPPPGIGSHAEPAPGRLQPPQPRDVPVQERDHRALGVVVERLVRDTVGVDAVPALPHRRRAAVDHGQPRGLGVLEQQPVRRVEMAVVGQHRQQVGRGQEAGRQVVARLAHQGGEVVGDALPVLVGHQPEASAPAPACAWVCGVTRPSAETNSRAPRVDDVRRQLGVPRGLLVATQHRGDASGVPRRPGVERGRDVGLVLRR